MDREGTSGPAALAGVFWTVSDLAAAADVTTGRIRQLLRGGRLEGVKVGGRWLVPDEAARRWLTSGRRTGRPPKKPEQLPLQLDKDG